jgi:hypothetical protein
MKAGFLAGIVAPFLMIVKRLIFDSIYNSSPLDPRILLGLLDMIIPLAVPMAAGGAIGGLIGELINKLQRFPGRLLILLIIIQRTQEV